MKRLIYTILCLIILSVSFFGCRKIVDFDEKDIKPFLVVNCIIAPEGSIMVDVTRSHSVLEKSDNFEPIKNAKITIDDGTSMITDFIYQPKFDTIYSYNRDGQIVQRIVEKGYYTSSKITIEPNRTYRIEVSAPGYESVFGETGMPSPIHIEKVDTFTVIQEQEYNDIISLKSKVFFTDPAGMRNFYRIEMDMASITFETDPATGEMNIYPYFTMGYLDTDDPVFNTDNSGNILETSSINRYGVFEDLIFEGKTYGFSLNLSNDWGTKIGFEDYDYDNSPYASNASYYYRVCKIKLSTLSESYYKYLRTIDLQKRSEQDPFSDPVLVYTNISNGSGIFGSSSVSERNISIHNMPPNLLTLLPVSDDEELFQLIKNQYYRSMGLINE
jgi:hypothetical protein